MNRFYFTFGTGTAYRSVYVEVEVEEDDFQLHLWPEAEDIAREAMYETHGKKWAFQYTEGEFAGQVERYGLKRLSLIKRNDKGLWTAVDVLGSE